MPGKETELNFVCESIDKPWIHSFRESLSYLFSKDKLPQVPKYRDAAPGELNLGPLYQESLHTPWVRSFRDTLSYVLSGQKMPEVPTYRAAYPGEPTLGPLVLDSLGYGWIKNRIESYRTWSADKKLPPLRLTSRPVAVKDLWGTFGLRRFGPLGSGLVHASFVAFLVLSGGPLMEDNTFGGDSVTLLIPVNVDFPDLSALKQMDDDSGGGGGGGNNSPIPPSRGRLPRFSKDQLVPPSVETPNPDAALQVEPTILVENMQQPAFDASLLGDPLASISMPSSGPGSGGGIGTGRGGGVGSGSGRGLGPGSGGGTGGGVYRVGGNVSAPGLIYKEEPEYSEEARKAKYQGTVTLSIEVWPDGKAHNIYVVRGLGLGLDEKAMEAVRKWKFRPGRKDGKPVKVSANVEVNFRLL